MVAAGRFCDNTLAKLFKRGMQASHQQHMKWIACANAIQQPNAAVIHACIFDDTQTKNLHYFNARNGSASLLPALFAAVEAATGASL